MNTYIADLHIHSRFSRATSKNLTPRNLVAWAAVKGIDVLATGDFTHPGWMEMIRSELEPGEDGLFRLRDTRGLEAELPWFTGSLDASRVRFTLCTEISSIYKRGGKVRKVHNLVFMPGLDAAQRFNTRLAQVGGQDPVEAAEMEETAARLARDDGGAGDVRPGIEPLQEGHLRAADVVDVVGEEVGLVDTRALALVDEAIHQLRNRAPADARERETRRQPVDRLADGVHRVAVAGGDVAPFVLGRRCVEPDPARQLGRQRHHVVEWHDPPSRTRASRRRPVHA